MYEFGKATGTPPPIHVEFSTCPGHRIRTWDLCAHTGERWLKAAVLDPDGSVGVVEADEADAPILHMVLDLMDPSLDPFTDMTLIECLSLVKTASHLGASDLLEAVANYIRPVVTASRPEHAARACCAILAMAPRGSEALRAMAQREMPLLEDLVRTGVVSGPTGVMELLASVSEDAMWPLPELAALRRAHRCCGTSCKSIVRKLHKAASDEAVVLDVLRGLCSSCADRFQVVCVGRDEKKRKRAV